MKIAVLGGGVIGVTTAYYLAKDGHSVTVFDRQPAAGLEASFANAGEISPGYASPWAAPGMPLKAMRWLFERYPPLILRARFDLQLLAWLGRLLANCTEQRYALNKQRMVRLAEFSRHALIELRATTGIAYDHRTLGTLQVFKAQKQLDQVGKDVEVLQALGIPFKILDERQCLSVEPGLKNARARVVGGLHLPNDETGDCFMFTSNLATLCRSAGVSFQFNMVLKQLRSDVEKVTGVVTDSGEIKADAYVIALGSYSASFVRSLKWKLPICPVKGYSMTVPIQHEDDAPQSTLLDETHKVAITRLGARIRVGGMAELAGFDQRLVTKRRATLEHSLASLFPRAAEATAERAFWCGLRSMTPDGTPIVGSTPLSNLYLNTGHGTLGWTMSCGSAQIIADLIAERPSLIERTDLSIARYGDSHARP